MNNFQLIAEECTDTREGKAQLLSNIDVWARIASNLKTTLGPYGMDKLFVNGENVLITNDGATILQNMNITHPAGRLLSNISDSQDSEVGDGTTSVVILATEILNSLRGLIKEDFDLKVIQAVLDELRGFCVQNLENMKIEYNLNLLYKLVETTLTSKVLKGERSKFSKMVVDGLMSLENFEDAKLLGIKKVQGGIKESELVDGIAFEKVFTYAGYEQQPKKIKNPKILCLNVELEWKSERENAEVRIKNVQEYQKVVDAEWAIIKEKLDKIIETGANVVLSSLPIGDYATQYFARHSIFCAGRVAKEDIYRVINACGGRVLSSTNYLVDCLGTCEMFEEKQVGKCRYNYLSGTSKKAVTLILRGPGSEILNEMERSLNDAVMVTKRTLKFKEVVTGGGSVEMELSKSVREKAKNTRGKEMFVMTAIAQAFESIPFQLAFNFGLDSVAVIQMLRKEHSEGKMHYGVHLKKMVSDMHEEGVIEPLIVKKNMIKAAFNAVKSLISVDSTIVVKPR